PRGEVAVGAVRRARDLDVVRQDRRGQVERVEHDTDRRRATGARTRTDALQVVDREREREVLLATKQILERVRRNGAGRDDAGRVRAALADVVRADSG